MTGVLGNVHHDHSDTKGLTSDSDLLRPTRWLDMRVPGPFSTPKNLSTLFYLSLLLPPSTANTKPTFFLRLFNFSGSFLLGALPPGPLFP